MLGVELICFSFFQFVIATMTEWENERSEYNKSFDLLSIAEIRRWPQSIRIDPELLQKSKSESLPQTTLAVAHLPELPHHQQHQLPFLRREHSNPLIIHWLNEHKLCILYNLIAPQLFISIGSICYFYQTQSDAFSQVCLVLVPLHQSA